MPAMATHRLKKLLSLLLLLSPVTCLRTPPQNQSINTASMPSDARVEQCSMLGNILCGAVSTMTGETSVEGRPACIARVESGGRRVEQCASAAAPPSSKVSLPTKSQQVPKPEPTKTAHLSWKDNSSNESGFRIYRITGNQITKLAEVGPNISSYSDQAAPPKACYVVVAFNSGGESPPTPKVCLVD